MASTADEDDIAALTGRLGRIVAGMAALVTLTAILWSSSLPLWVGWRLYSEQVLVVALALAITFLTRPAGRAPGRFDKVAAAVSLGYGAYMTVWFPVLSQNVFYHPTEALIVSGVGFVLPIEGVRRSMGWALIVILGVGGQQCRVNRSDHHSADEGGRLQAQDRRSNRGGGQHRGPVDAADHGCRRLPFGREPSGQLWHRDGCRNRAVAAVLRQPVHLCRSWAG